MKNKRKSRNVFCFLSIILLFPLVFNAQVFTLNGGFQEFSAQDGGVPDEGNGMVRVRRAPTSTGNVTRIRRLLNEATIPDNVIDSRLTEGPFARHIAQMPAMISVAEALNNRLATRSNINGAFIINNTSDLNANRSRLRSNSDQIFIFRGNVDVPSEIELGSNKTIWIDGRINWTGGEIEVTPGDEFSPLGTIRRGVFRIIDKRNVTIRGTKRGLANCNRFIPFIYCFSSSDSSFNDLEIINGYNTLFIHQSWRVNAENNFLYNNVRRGMHILAVGTGTYKNNLVFDNHLDGIDIDAFSSNIVAELNVVVGARHRNMLWTEIDARDNLMDNNVGIHLEERRGVFSGGFEENGTENERRPENDPNSNFMGSRNNTWTNNNVFYAVTARAGIFMFRNRFIQHRTIAYQNNYVWTTQGNINRHNPRPEGNMPNDVRFLTLQNPAVGSREIRNFFPSGVGVLNTTPGNLSQARLRVTPNREGREDANCNSAPSGLRATGSTNTTITFSFNNTSGDTRVFELRAFERGTFNGNINQGAIAFAAAQAGQNSITIRNLQAATTYDFIFRALCPGESPSSSPLAPTLTSSTAGSSNNDSEFFIVNRQTRKRLRPQANGINSPIIQSTTTQNNNFVRWEQINTNNGYFHLRNVETGDYFRPNSNNTSNVNGSPADGSPITQRPTTFSGNFTQWRRVNTSEGFFYLQNRATRMYFRPTNDADNSPIIQRPTTFSGNYTQWTFEGGGSAKDLNTLNNKSAILYPSPVRKGQNININTNIELGNSNISVIIYNLNGTRVYESIFKEGEELMITTEKFSSGMYIVHMTSDGSTITEKLIVN